MAEGNSSLSAYSAGQNTDYSFTPNGAYAHGGGSQTDSLSSFLDGNAAASSSLGAYTPGGSNTTQDALYAFAMGILRSNISGHLEGQSPGEGVTVAQDHIWLKTSDLSTQKKFRVIAQDYDDGTPEKAESLRRTIGGGVDRSVGGIYTTWSPTIRVRWEEPITDYGTLADLEYFFELNNPNATPSNVVTFIDHHGVSRNVILVGSLKKSVLTSSIEGQEAWYIVRITLMELPNA